MSPDYVTRLRVEIERREQSKHYYDAAEGQRWFNEMVPRQDNERCLNNAYGRLEAALCPPPPRWQTSPLGERPRGEGPAQSPVARPAYQIYGITRDVDLA
jgi:hypothetical protein